jgi:hypothetical protein
MRTGSAYCIRLVSILLMMVCSCVELDSYLDSGVHVYVCRRAIIHGRCCAGSGVKPGFVVEEVKTNKRVVGRELRPEVAARQSLCRGLLLTLFVNLRCEFGVSTAF